MRTEKQREARKARKRATYGLPAPERSPFAMYHPAVNPYRIYGKRVGETDVTPAATTWTDHIQIMIRRYRKPKHPHFRSK